MSSPRGLQRAFEGPGSPVSLTLTPVGEPSLTVAIRSEVSARHALDGVDVTIRPDARA